MLLAIQKATKQTKLLKAKLVAKTKALNKRDALKAYYKLILSTKPIKAVKSKLSTPAILKSTNKRIASKPTAKKASTKATTSKATATKATATKAKATTTAKPISKASATKATTAKATSKATASKAKATATKAAKPIATKNYISLRTANLVPTKNTIVGRFIVENVDSYTRANAGQQALLPLILALFLVIAISNTLSNVPYGYAAASSLSFSLGLSLSVFIAVTASALTLLGLQWFAHFALDSPSFLAPILVLIETISYSARAVSLGVRLFANLEAGHALLNIISKMGKQSILSR